MLKKKSTEQVICTQLKKAESFFTRLIGLIGTKQMNDEGLLFPRANHIHTLFMSMPIDVVYVNKNMKIVKIDHSLKPWRVPMPVFKAHSLIELPSGWAKQKQLSVGDELYVGH